MALPKVGTGIESMESLKVNSKIKLCVESSERSLLSTGQCKTSQSSLCALGQTCVTASNSFDSYMLLACQLSC